MQKMKFDQTGNPLTEPVTKGYAEPYPDHPAVPQVQALKPSKGEDKGWRDVAFAIAFFIVVIAIIAIAGIWGVKTLSNSPSEKSSGSVSRSESLAFLGFGLGSCGIAALASFVVVKFMVKHASKMIPFALWFQIGLSLLTALISFAAGAIVFGILGLIFTALGVCYARLVRHRIPFATANLKVAAEAIKTHASTHGVAFLFLIVQVIWIMLWSVAAIGVINKSDSSSSSSGVKSNGDFCDYNSECASGSCTNGYCAHKSQSVSFVAYFFLLLALYWGLSVLRNITHCTVVGTVATWWYSADSKGATLSSLRRSCTTSLGSICFGSLVVAIIQVLRSIADQSSRDGSILGCVAACLLSCLQNLVEYFNRWAYVYVGIYGYKYMEAGKAVLTLFRSRGFDAIINDDLIQNVLMLAALAVGLICGAICVGIYYTHKSMLSNDGAPVIVGILGFVVGAGIATVPLSVIDSAVATIFVCFAEDPVSFARSHPDLYSSLVAEWHRVYPDVIISNGYYVA